MLFYSGLEMATHVKDLKTKQEWIICLVTAAGSLYKNTGIGFLAGFGIICFDRIFTFFSGNEDEDMNSLSNMLP